MNDIPRSVAGALEGGQWLDISRPLSSTTPVWPGDQPFELRQGIRDGMVLSSLVTTCHVGTHVDAPLHLDAAADPVEAIPLARLVGRAEVVRVSAGTDLVGVDALPRRWSPRSARVLFRTDSHGLNSPIGSRYCALEPRFVDWLADRGVELVGMDTPSVDPFDSDRLPAHRALARRGLTWVEGLWLAQVEPGEYLLLALPLPLVGAEAAPLRALLRPLAEGSAVTGVEARRRDHES
jgi:arylformamidase